MKITKNIKEANLITHGSTFHPDDVFATMFISKMVENPIVCRTNNIDHHNKDAIIYDIGYGKFDHHQVDAKVRNNGIKYSSFGLLFSEYGKTYLSKLNIKDVDKLYTSLEEKLVMQIDAIDNGIFPEINAPYKISDLDKIISDFNLAWNEEGDNDDQFLEAVLVADKIFTRAIIKENALIEANILVEEKLNEVKDNILILDKYMPYEETLWNSKNPKAKEVKVVILPSNRGGYSIKPRTKNKNTKELAYNFSKEFLGLHDEELVKVSHIKTAKFVHSSGFLGCTDTLEDAIILAKNAIENKNI